MTAVEVAGALFSHLESNDLDYAVVGDSRDCSQTIPSDLDLIIDQNSLDRIRMTLVEFCEEHVLASPYQ
jgi:hypothetical protein